MHGKRFESRNKHKIKRHVGQRWRHLLKLIRSLQHT